MTVKMTPRVALVLIAALFILPLLLAWLMYTGTIDFQPASTRNLGQLVEPPRPLVWDGVRVVDEPGFATGDFDGHWLVLHVLPPRCDAACMDAVVALRQVHRAAGRNQDRIRLGLLRTGNIAEPEQLRQVYESFHVLEDRDGGLRDRLATIAGEANPAAATEGSTYLVDPLGNIMMFYAPGSDANNLKKDLKRLLTWSKLDEQS